MSDLGQLFFGIAAIITAIGGVVTSVLAITKGSPKERKAAARHAIARVLGTDDDDEDDDRHDAITEIVDEVLRRRGDE